VTALVEAVASTQKVVHPPRLKATHPGELVGADTFYVGKLKGVGQIWQYTATDVASSYTFC